MPPSRHHKNDFDLSVSLSWLKKSNQYVYIHENFFFTQVSLYQSKECVWNCHLCRVHFCMVTVKNWRVFHITFLLYWLVIAVLFHVDILNMELFAAWFSCFLYPWWMFPQLLPPGRAAAFFSCQCHIDAADRWHNLDKCFGFVLPITLSSHIKWPKSNPVRFLPDMKARKTYDLNQTWKSEVVQFSVQETTRSTDLSWISMFLLQPFINNYENV